MEEKIIVEGIYNEKSDKARSLIGLILGCLGIAVGVVIIFMFLDTWDPEIGFVVGGIVSGLSLGFVIFMIYCITHPGKKRPVLTVTDRRVYGKVRKNRLDMPINTITSVKLIGEKEISISSASGNISFNCFLNNQEIHKAIMGLISDNRVSNPAPTIIQQSDSADELKKFKSLLDSGVITQEEFDAKKKQLLGL